MGRGLGPMGFAMYPNVLPLLQLFLVDIGTGHKTAIQMKPHEIHGEKELLIARPGIDEEDQEGAGRRGGKRELMGQ